MNNEQAQEEEYKTIVIGTSGVGKTTLLVRFLEDKFLGNNSPTVGIDLQTKEVEYASTKFKLQLWDTAGQERFRTIVKGYFNRSKAAVIVFDISEENSFDDIKYWLEELTQRCGTEIPKIVVGNKIDRLAPADLNATVETLERKLEPLKTQYKFEFLTASSLTGENTKTIFNRIVQLIYKHYLEKKVRQKRVGSRINEPVSGGYKNNQHRCCS